MLRRLLPRIALLLATCLLLLVAAEIAARILLPSAAFGEDPALAGKYHPYRRMRYHSDIDGFDVDVLLNSLGMRDREHPIEKPPGRFRILVLGDSFMEAKQVEMEQGFCARLEEILSATREVEVINSGHAGFGCVEECLVLKQFGLPRRPDLVIQAFFMNDVSDDAAVRDEIEYAESGAPVKMRPEGPRSRFAQWLGARWDMLPFRQKDRLVENDDLGDPEHDPFAILRPGRAMRDEAAWKRSLAAIRETARLAQSAGAQYALVVIPLAQQVDPTLGGRVAEVWRLAPGELTDFPQQRLSRFGEQQGLAVLDLLPLFRAHKTEHNYFRNDGHWTAAGHALAADAVCEYLVSHDLVQ